MANEEQLAILRQGVKAWNKWREENPDVKVDLGNADISEINLGGYGDSDYDPINLRDAILEGANLRRANLTGADLQRAYLRRADLQEANLHESHLFEANLIGANLSLVDFRFANLRFVNFSGANLGGADLRFADLEYSTLVGTNIHDAKISESRIYGIGVWDLLGEFKEQSDLIITPYESTSVITVDNIKVAQFIYLIMNNEEIRDVIDTLTSKSVLILGRFAIEERKIILDALRNKLREFNLLPIVFDFDRPTDKDFTETIKTLAGLSYFVIADITNPKSSPLELQATVPDYQIPFVPIIQKGEKPFAMMRDLQNQYRDWVLDTLEYESIDELIEALKPAIIDPAIEKHNELRLIKAREPKIRSAKDFLGK